MKRSPCPASKSTHSLLPPLESWLSTAIAFGNSESLPPMGQSLGTPETITRWKPLRKRVGSGSAVDGEPAKTERLDEFIQAFILGGEIVRRSPTPKRPPAAFNGRSDNCILPALDFARAK